MRYDLGEYHQLRLESKNLCLPQPALWRKEGLSGKLMPIKPLTFVFPLLFDKFWHCGKTEIHSFVFLTQHMYDLAQQHVFHSTSQTVPKPAAGEVGPKYFSQRTVMDGCRPRTEAFDGIRVPQICCGQHRMYL